MKMSGRGVRAGRTQIVLVYQAGSGNLPTDIRASASGTVP